jgi:hypothetical protein
MAVLCLWHVAHCINSGSLEYGVRFYIIYLDNPLLCGEAVANGDECTNSDSKRSHTEYRRITFNFCRSPKQIDQPDYALVCMREKEVTIIQVITEMFSIIQSANVLLSPLCFSEHILFPQKII